MALCGSIYKRLILMFILPVLAMASAMAQGGVSVFVGETKTYQVENHAGSLYFWTIYNEPTFSKPATNAEIRIVSGENSSTITITWLETGTYYPTVVETNLEGCTNKKAMAISVREAEIPLPVARISNPTVTIDNLQYIMATSCRPLLIDASSSTGEGLTFLWEPSVYIDNPPSPTPTFTPGVTTTYQLTVTDIYGNSNTLPVGIMVAPVVKAEAGEDVFIRAGQQGLLDASASTGKGLAYLWTTQNGHIVDGNTTKNPVVDMAGRYYLTVTDLDGCSDIDSVMVNLYTQATRDTIKTKINFTFDFNVLANDIPRQNLDPSTLRIVDPPENGIAMVVADSVISYQPNEYFVGSDAFIYSICDYYQHCDQASVLVIVNDNAFFIPEAFSPNGDGINDKFEIQGIAKYKNIEIEIFNRWGNIVYQSKNYGEGPGREGFWDGTARSGLRIGSGPVPSGTYFYVLRLDSKEKINGSIYLDR
jgi:gliding motility-associated-like protein